MRRILVLSGAIASGKTSLGDLLKINHGFERIKTRELIAERQRVAAQRGLLQGAGDDLDRATGGKWVADALDEKTRSLPPNADVLVDAVRIEPQITAIRERFGSRVTHVHLTAPLDVLTERYHRRGDRAKEFASYEEVRANQTEANVEQLADIADTDVEVRVAGHLGLYGRAVERLVDVLVGGQYGSEGKGQVSAYLARDYDVLVRVGGPNAGHKVYGVPPYTFHLLPSGTRTNEAHLVLGPGAVLSVDTLMKEIRECQVTPERLSIDPQAMIIDEADVAFERAGLERSIGSTAQGVGAATSRKVLRTAASPAVRLAKEIEPLRPYVRDTCSVLERAFARGQRVFLEGTQGTGLSLHHGSYPYVTSRDTTVAGCLAEAGLAPSRVRKIIAVCRTYPIRVTNPGGDSGPIGSELDWAEISRRSGVELAELERHEKTSTTNRPRRVAEFDWTLFRRAVSLNGPSDIALTFVDYISVKNRAARRFEQLTAETIQFVEEIERVSSASVSLIATRFHARSIIDRRNW